MTHIRRFPARPDVICEARTSDMAYNDASSYPGTLALRRPEETAETRLKGVIAHVCSNRKSGILEVVLTQNTYATWKDTLKALGFKLVNVARNSNSGNILHVFHLNTGNQAAIDSSQLEMPSF